MTLVQYAPARTFAATNRRTSWKPAVDIVENENGFTLAFDLPGLKREDITVNVKENVLTVTGTREISKPDETGYYRYFERNAGTFTRSFTLPHYVDGGKVTAAYEQGVLTLDIPKKEEAKPHVITVK